MSEPDIARRCPACGASIREVALFCPQCGNAQPSQKSAQSQPPVADAPPETTSKNTAPLAESEVPQPKTLADTIALKQDEAAPTASTDAKSSDTIAIERPAGSAKATGSARTRGVVGTNLKRATTIARGVEGDVIQRVQKVRQISHVVLDEAGDDPGLRFLLVAIVVFILFLVIVLLNKFIS